MLASGCGDGDRPSGGPLGEGTAGAGGSPLAGGTAGAGGSPLAGGTAGAGGSGGSREPATLVINELAAKNEGTSVDEFGETDDWLELLNVSDENVDLAEFVLTDGGGATVALPPRTLAAGEYVVLWADGEPEQGPLHLPFKLDADGERVSLIRAGEPTDAIVSPKLSENESFARFPDGDGAFARCRYASPGRANGEACTPPAAPALPSDVTFAPYELDDDYPHPPGPIVISEAALHPAGFVELVNESDETQPLSAYHLRLAETAPGEEFPGTSDGHELPLPDELTLQPGERVSVEVSDDVVSQAISNALFEGVLTVFDEDAEVVDRWDFMRWPEDAILTRFPDAGSHAIFCRNASPGAPNLECDAVPSREVGDRVRHLRTPGDFAALAEGARTLGMAPVKFVHDMRQDGAVHLLSSRVWPLHYTFIREIIDQQPPLDRCDPDQRNEFNAGWYAFSRTEYYQTEGRRYLLGTLVHHSGADLHTVEYALGDAISGEDMRRGFLAAMGHVPDPSIWRLRPQDETQTATALEVDGTLPIVSTNAPFNGITFQPLTPGIGYGTLRYVPAAELGDAELSPEIIVVTDDVPNDIALVGGLITEAFQTPLAHVNVLSQTRGTPNMALLDASTDDRISPYLDTLVRLEVTSDGFTISEAPPEEAEAYWESLRPSGTVESPRLDLDTRDLVDLAEAAFDALPAIGAKAAQFAELGRVSATLPSACVSAHPWTVPANAFAIPVVHFVEHFRTSGAESLLDSLKADIEFRTDPGVRASGLAAVRQTVLDAPVDPALLEVVERWIDDRFGTQRVRLRSSSNAEDLTGFGGAGLYTSTSAELGSPERSVADALRTVWASLYNARAYDERELAGIDHRAVAMGVLVHEAFLSERANGVAISRDILDPIRSDIYYMNAQIGEASVTNPAPGVITEEFIFRWPPRFPLMSYYSRSSLSPNAPVLSEGEAISVACALRAIHAHFAPLLDPERSNAWFTMEAEFKFVGDARDLVIKQARPHTFGSYEIIDDCREI